MEIHSLIILIPLVFALVTGQWELLPGQAAVQISAKGTELWVVNKFYALLHWTNDGWSHEGGFGTHVAATMDGCTWSVNAIDHGSIWKHAPNTSEWMNVPGELVNVNAKSNQSAVGVNSTGFIWRYESGVWNNLEYWIGNNFITAMDEGGGIWKLDTNGNLYRYDGRLFHQHSLPTAKFNSSATYLDAQTSTRLVITDQNLNAWLWNGTDWTKLRGKKCSQATINTKYVFCLDPNGYVWRLAS